jgi:hypothetical protein
MDQSIVAKQFPTPPCLPRMITAMHQVLIGSNKTAFSHFIANITTTTIHNHTTLAEPIGQLIAIISIASHQTVEHIVSEFFTSSHQQSPRELT